MSSNDIICKCKGITKGEVRKLLKSGMTSFKEIKKATGVTSKCGKCKSKVKKYIKKHS
jgi:bacterioferritin-associated ferredoxin